MSVGAARTVSSEPKRPSTRLPFDSEAGRAYGRIYAAVGAAGRQARGARAVDLMMAATALSARLPLLTRNSADFRALDDLVEVVEV